MKAKIHNIPRAYEAGKASTQHKAPRRTGSADAGTGAAGTKLRDWARWLDENHDVVTGAMDKLTNFIVGEGISIQPMVRTRRGVLLDSFNDQIHRVLLDEDDPSAWSRDTCVTGEYTRGEMEWTACRTWLRDGEILARLVRRRTTRAAIPYQVQLLEGDYLPYELIELNYELGRNQIIHGVEKDEWGKPVRYHLYAQHPGDVYRRGHGLIGMDMRVIPARDIRHLKYTRRRVGQTRGVPIFHAAIYRLDDIADYETAHRVAARIAAQLIGSIKRNPEMIEGYDSESDKREWELENGSIISDMLPGEELAWNKPEAPNVDATPFLDDQMRRAATGFGIGYSTFSGKYDKSYSAARQEQSENWPNIKTLRAQFVSDFVRVAEYEPALDAAIQSGRLRVPREVDPRTLYAADYRGPARPPIDDEKQANADQLQIEAKLDSRHGRIREHGRNPKMVDSEIEADTMRETDAAAEAESERIPE